MFSSTGDILQWLWTLIALISFIDRQYVQLTDMTNLLLSLLSEFRKYSLHSIRARTGIHLCLNISFTESVFQLPLFRQCYCMYFEKCFYKWFINECYASSLLHMFNQIRYTWRNSLNKNTFPSTRKAVIKTSKEQKLTNFREFFLLCNKNE